MLMCGCLWECVWVWLCGCLWLYVRVCVVFVGAGVCGVCEFVWVCLGVWVSVVVCVGVFVSVGVWGCWCVWLFVWVCVFLCVWVWALLELGLIRGHKRVNGCALVRKDNKILSTKLSLQILKLNNNATLNMTLSATHRPAAVLLLT